MDQLPKKKPGPQATPGGLSEATAAATASISAAKGSIDESGKPSVLHLIEKGDRAALKILQEEGYGQVVSLEDEPAGPPGAGEPPKEPLGPENGGADAAAGEVAVSAARPSEAEGGPTAEEWRAFLREAQRRGRSFKDVFEEVFDFAPDEEPPAVDPAGGAAEEPAPASGLATPAAGAPEKKRGKGEAR